MESDILIPHIFKLHTCHWRHFYKIIWEKSLFSVAIYYDFGQS